MAEMEVPAEKPETATIIVHPGDVVQITDNRHQLLGCVAICYQVYSWGIHANLRIPGRMGDTPGTVIVMPGRDSTVDITERLKPGQFMVVGTAVLLPPDVIAARRDSIETARLVAEEAGR